MTSRLNMEDFGFYIHKDILGVIITLMLEEGMEYMLPILRLVSRNFRDSIDAFIKNSKMGRNHSSEHYTSNGLLKSYILSNYFCAYNYVDCLKLLIIYSCNIICPTSCIDNIYSRYGAFIYRETDYCYIVAVHSDSLECFKCIITSGLLGSICPYRRIVSADSIVGSTEYRVRQNCYRLLSTAMANGSINIANYIISIYADYSGCIWNTYYHCLIIGDINNLHRLSCKPTIKKILKVKRRKDITANLIIEKMLRYTDMNLVSCKSILYLKIREHIDWSRKKPKKLLVDSILTKYFKL